MEQAPSCSGIQGLTSKSFATENTEGTEMVEEIFNAVLLPENWSNELSVNFAVVFSVSSVFSVARL